MAVANLGYHNGVASVRRVNGNTHRHQTFQSIQIIPTDCICPQNRDQVGQLKAEFSNGAEGRLDFRTFLNTIHLKTKEGKMNSEGRRKMKREISELNEQFI